MEATLTVKTASGSTYIITHGDMLTRLSETPMRDGDGSPLDTILWAEEMTDLKPIEVGKAIRCTVLGKPLRTSAVVSMEWEWA